VATSAGPTIATSGHVQDIAVHDGDVVRGTGEVIAVPGKPVIFCSPLTPSDLMFEPFAHCPIGVPVLGADVDNLYDRRTRNGMVRGSATITGLYHDGSIQVRDQVAARFAAPIGVGNDSVPCPRPADGWPHRQPPLGAAERYRRDHPGSVVQLAYLNPNDTESLVYVLTAGDPTPVQDALDPAYPDALCVQQSQYTAQQVGAAHRFAIGLMHGRYPLTRPTAAGGIGLSDTEQVSVYMMVAMVDNYLATKIDTQPAGLVEVEVWLAPVSP
jgi:hypothetical protein